MRDYPWLIFLVGLQCGIAVSVAAVLFDRIRARRRKARQEIEDMASGWGHQRRQMDKRIAEVFTPQEWHETQERCIKQLADQGIDVSDLRYYGANATSRGREARL